MIHMDALYIMGGGNVREVPRKGEREKWGLSPFFESQMRKMGTVPIFWFQMRMRKMGSVPISLQFLEISKRDIEISR
jgi:hypothetical protein